MIKPNLDAPLPQRIERVHFSGVGGSGMSALAKVFLEIGCTVSGTDRDDSASLQELARLGARVQVGHDAAMLSGADTLVYSGAIAQDNPEYLAAKQQNLAVLHRCMALKWLTDNKRLVSVAGSHGKTSTTGMLAAALTALGADPGFVNGSRINGLDRSSAAGSTDVFVIEADESDGSFLCYETAIAVINNISLDHVDHYADAAALEQAFLRFANGVGQRVIISADDPACQRIIAELRPEKVITFGWSPAADVRLVSVDSLVPTRFRVTYRQQTLTATFREVFGEHQAVNACGALGALLALGYEFEPALQAVTSFSGTKRRLEYHGQVGGAGVFDDYAHHPKEVLTALRAMRNLTKGRLIAVHQPHLYSRTQAFFREFAAVLEQEADFTIVLPVCGAREDPLPGVSGQLVSGAFADQSKVIYCASWEEAAAFFRGFIQADDVAITLGCGDVYRIIPELLGQKP